MKKKKESGKERKVKCSFTSVLLSSIKSYRLIVELGSGLPIKISQSCNHSCKVFSFQTAKSLRIVVDVTRKLKNPPIAPKVIIM